MKPLAALMAVLVALLGWESLPASGDPTDIASAVSPVIRAAPPEAPAPIAAWTNVILARPLFAQDRRPRLGAAAAPRQAAAPEELPRLAGTVRSNNILMAIFAPAGLHSAAAAANLVAAMASPGGPIQGGTPPERTPRMCVKSQWSSAVTASWRAGLSWTSWIVRSRLSAPDAP